MERTPRSERAYTVQGATPVVRRVPRFRQNVRASKNVMELRFDTSYKIIIPRYTQRVRIFSLVLFSPNIFHVLDSIIVTS